MNNYEIYADEYFKKDIFATKTTGIQIEKVEKNYAKCKMPIDERHLNAAGFVMGGAIYTLADFTFAVASNQKEQWTVSVSSTINYINCAKCNELFSEAKCIKEGKTTVFYEISIFDNKNTIIAKILTNGHKLGV